MSHRIEHTGPLRADAEGEFVPADAAPGARTGDAITVVSTDDGTERQGTVDAVVDGPGGAFLRVRFDGANAGDNARFYDDHDPRSS